MTNSQRLTVRSSELRQRLNQIAGLDGDAVTDEIRAESDRLGVEYGTVETQLRAALVAEAAETAAQGAQDGAGAVPDAETRERVDLRSRARLGRFLGAAFGGRVVDGAEAEYAAACDVAAGGIPLDLWESDRPVETRADAATPHGLSTSEVGHGVAPLQPRVFSDSIAARLGVSMPSVGSGSHSWARISTPLTAGAKAKGSAAESTAAALTAVTASPRRISARLSIDAEDVASIGTSTFEPALRSNLQGALSDAYDGQCVGGDGEAPNVNGLLNQLTAPTAPTAVATFDSWIATYADQVDGIWARTVRDVVMVAGVAAYKLSVKTFRDKEIDETGKAAVSLGAQSIADYLAAHTGGWSSAARMPAPASTGDRANIADAIVRRTGRSLLACVHPVWGSMSIDDVYTDSASARRHVTLHVLVGDKVLIVQPDAFKRASFKVS